MQLLYVTPQEILDFWFDKDTRRHWFTESQYLDLKIRTTYERVFRNAVNCELSDWRDTIQGRLAEIIILDQFSRAIFRGKPHAYTQDRMALLLAQEAVRHQSFPFMEARQRQFILMPFIAQPKTATSIPRRWVCSSVSARPKRCAWRQNTNRLSTASAVIRTATRY